VLSPVIDVFRLRQYFNVITRTRQVAGLVRQDASFLSAVRRALVTLPFETAVPIETQPFPEAGSHRLDRVLAGRRFGLVATGGSGALASVVGVWKALEESHITPDVVSVCSGSSLFGFPLAAGIPADEVAEFTLSLRTEDYVDVNWTGLASVAFDVGRGFAGMVVGDRIEQTYRRLVGDMTLAEMPTPCYAPIWNIEENRLEYAGPRTHPDLPVARLIRAAIAIPLFIDPVRIDGLHWCDGGIVDIFPVRPVLEIEEPCEVVLAVNGFYPPDFAGESDYGWKEARASVLRIASQVRTSQQIELARTNLARLRAEAEVMMIDPVPYTAVMGAGFYKHFIDRSSWPDFMRAGRADALHSLRSWAARVDAGGGVAPVRGGRAPGSSARKAAAPAVAAAPRAAGKSAPRPAKAAGGTSPSRGKGSAASRSPSPARKSAASSSPSRAKKSAATTSASPNRNSPSRKATTSPRRRTPSSR
jgi:NTE family protein